MVALAKMNAPGGSYQLHTGHFTTPDEGAMQDQSTVVYKDIPGFPGYRIGNDGSVWSCRPKNGQGPFVSWRRIKPQMNKGYLRVAFKNDRGGNTWKIVHRLLLEIFIGHPPRPEMNQACHIDGNRLNNSLDNLRWGSIHDNQADKVRHGRVSRGATHGMSKLTDADATRILILVAGGRTKKSVADEYGISRVTVGDIVSRRTWRHLTPALFA